MPQMPFLIIAFSALGAFWATEGVGYAQGRYETRREKRGEVTATHPKLSAFAFINDAMEQPLRLRLFVDAGRARNSFRKDLISFELGMAYGGKGPALPLQPSRFELSWDTDTTHDSVAGIDNEELLDLPEGRASLHTEELIAAARVRALPFDRIDGLPIPTRFYTDPHAKVFLNDDTELTPGSWFVDRVYFHVPEGLELEARALRLSYLTAEGDDALISVDFRIEEDPGLHRKAFRKARKAKKKANRRERRRERRLHDEASPE